MTSHTPILIVGAGPTGLTLACELARRNVPLRIIDKLEEPAPWARATGIKTRTLEVLAAMGLIDRFLERGLRVHEVRTFAEGRLVSRLCLENVDSPYPFMLSLGQEETDGILTKHLAHLGASIERGLELVGIEASDGPVRAVVKDRSGSQSEISADWLVGCDGSHSTVRTTMNRPLEGFDYPDSKLLGLVRLDGWANPQNTFMNFIGNGWIFTCQELPDQTFLLSGTAGDPESAQTDTQEAMLSIWRTRLQQAMPSATISEVLWVSRFHIRLGIAPTYRAGRILIAGDAAHQFSPEGAPGMNTGIQDAFNLAWKLALVAKRRASESLIDTYEPERRQIALQAGVSSDRAERDLSKIKPSSSEGHDRLIGLQNPMMQRAIIEQVADLKHGYRASPLSQGFRETPMSAHHRVEWPDPWPGDRLPDAFPLVIADGSHATLHQLAWGEATTLVLLVGVADEQRLAEQAGLIDAVMSDFGDVIEALVIVQADSPPQFPGFPCRIAADPTDQVHQRLGVLTDSALVVRPDGYVAYRGETPNKDDLLGYFGNFLRDEHASTICV